MRKITFIKTEVRNLTPVFFTFSFYNAILSHFQKKIDCHHAFFITDVLDSKCSVNFQIL